MNKKNDIPILILHSWNQYANDVSRYDPLVNELKQRGYTVYIPELPGFYSAGLPDKVLTRDDYVEFIENYLKKNGLKKIIFIGHSFGGTIGIKLAHKNPSLFQALILTGAPGYPPVPKLLVLIYMIIAKVGNRVFSLPLLSLIREIPRKLLYKSVGATDYPKAQGVMREILKNVTTENLEPFMKDLRVPTILLWGKGDNIAPLGIGKKMHTTIPNSKLITLNGRHGIPFTHAKEFVDSVEKNIQKA